MGEGRAMERLAAYLAGQPLPGETLARLLVEGDARCCRTLEARLCLDRGRDRTLAQLIEQARAELDETGNTAY